MESDRLEIEFCLHADFLSTQPVTPSCSLCSSHRSLLQVPEIFQVSSSWLFSFCQYAIVYLEHLSSAFHLASSFFILLGLCLPITSPERSSFPTLPELTAQHINTHTGMCMCNIQIYSQHQHVAFLLNDIYQILH